LRKELVFSPTRLVYPASGYDRNTIIAALVAWPTIKKIVLIDPRYSSREFSAEKFIENFNVMSSNMSLNNWGVNTKDLDWQFIGEDYRITNQVKDHNQLSIFVEVSR